MKRFGSHTRPQSRRYLGLLIVFTMFSTPLRAQKPEKQSWENLNQLGVGQRIQVVRMNFKSETGRFLSFSEEAVSLRVKGNEMAIPRKEVLRVTLREGSKRMRNMLIGLAIGGGAGFAFGAAADAKRGDDEKIATAVLSLVGLGAGAGIGAANPTFQTVYRTKAKRGAATR